MLHVASPPPGRSRHSHTPINTPSLNGEGSQCGVVDGYAPPRAPPQWVTRVNFCLRRQQRHSPHCETHALGRADAPRTGRLERSGSRNARGGSHHSPRGGRSTAEGRACVTRGGECGGWAHSVSPLCTRTLGEETTRRFSFFWSKVVIRATGA